MTIPGGGKGPMDETYALVRRKDAAVAFRYRARALTAASAIMRHLKPQGPLQVLDFGSADGTSVLEMRRLLPSGTAITGIEYSAALVSLAGDLGADIQIVQGDIAALPECIRPRRYDVVTALAVLEHLPQPLVALREAAAVLKSGGIIVATCPDPVWDALATRSGLLEDHHEARLPRLQLMAFARQVGLDVLEYRRFMWAPIGFLPYVRIRVSPAFSHRLDEALPQSRLLRWLFINQLLVARKP